MSSSSIIEPDTWFGLHFRNTWPANSWTINQRGLSSTYVAPYAHIPLIKLYFFMSHAASFLSWSFPTKCVVGSAPFLLNPVIRWIRSIVISTLQSNHRYPLCMHDNKTLTTALISLLRPKWGICSKFSSPDGYNKAIQSCGVNASTFVVGLTVITMYWSTWNCGNLTWSNRL